MDGPIAQFESLLASADFLFVVVCSANLSSYYRGHWCPFCVNYTKTLQRITGKISAAGGRTVIVTSEVPEYLEAFRKATGYTETAIVDPANVLATELKTRGLVDIAITAKRGYPHGMAQPGVLVIKKDGTVLYSWAIVPSLMNLKGAKDRPNLGQVWDNVDAKMHDKPVVHKAYHTQTFSGVMMQKIFG